MNDDDKIRIIYSFDFREIGNPAYKGWCLHLVCLDGEGSFVYNERLFRMVKDNVAVIAHPEKVRNIAQSDDMRVEMVIAPMNFLVSQLPKNNPSIGGCISLFSNPILPLGAEEAERFIDDIHHIRKRMEEGGNVFYQEMMGSLLLTMMYDLFNYQANIHHLADTTDRTSFVVRGFTDLLETGITKTQRDVSYFAAQLHVSPKYLSSTIKRVTGVSVTRLIDKYTIPMLVEYLRDDKMSFTQIADEMNFATLSYFSRYVTKHLGVSPKQYRLSSSPIKHLD
jgi:AraC family transcriptional activator of pobA